MTLLHNGMKKLQRWTHLSSESNSSCLQRRRKRYLCGTRLLSTFDPERDTFRYVRDNLTDLQCEAVDGSSAQMIVKTFRFLCWSHVNPGKCSLFVGFLQTRFSATKTRQFTLQFPKVGQALNTSNSEISRDFLNENIRGISLAELQV